MTWAEWERFRVERDRVAADMGVCLGYIFSPNLGAGVYHTRGSLENARHMAAAVVRGIDAMIAATKESE